MCPGRAGCFGPLLDSVSERVRKIRRRLARRQRRKAEVPEPFAVESEVGVVTPVEEICILPDTFESVKRVGKAPEEASSPIDPPGSMCTVDAQEEESGESFMSASDLAEEEALDEFIQEEIGRISRMAVLSDDVLETEDEHTA